MINHRMSSLICSLLFLFSIMYGCHGSERKTYIVYMGGLPEGGVPPETHKTMLKKVQKSDIGGWPIYTYRRSFNGFAANLTEDEAKELLEMDEVVSVFLNKKLELHTTRSWDFMGFPQNTSPQSPTEGDIIIGMLDTGLWPESKSFADDGLGPPPAKWNGTCQSQSNNFTCNNKIIGARYYNSGGFYNRDDFKSPRDAEGHGSHTSSTAAGRAVPGASYYDIGEGIARGAVPTARIAVYKVCWLNAGCYSVDILAAFDDAIADGVDIISVSLGHGSVEDYTADPIAIGSFHAMKKGILTSNSGGNSGPDPRSVTSNAPWLLTVAASSIDRKFVSRVELGNGRSFMGNAINNFQVDSVFPLLYGGDAPNVSAGYSSDYSKSCYLPYMNSVKVKGKVLLCDGVTDVSGFTVAGVLGVIMSSSDYSDLAYSFSIPATLLSIEDADGVLEYIRSTSDPFGTILKTEALKDELAPVVVSFSSRGPNTLTPDILKPDLTAPGVDILAAWSPVSSPTGDSDDHRKVSYNIISGTSMACPHASGAAAYIKSVHPSWSPAAIKSALMTTASAMDPRKNTDAEFAYGSGFIDPLRALNPGLVFDANEKDYIDFLCSQGYNTTTVRLVTGDNSTCPGRSVGNPWSLNYPSFALSVPDSRSANSTFRRTVTNVGSPNSTYRVNISAPSSLTITVKPSTLFFSEVGEMKTFAVKVRSRVLFQEPVLSASIVWTDDEGHYVRTPIAVYTVIPPSSTTGTTQSFNASSLPQKHGLFKRT